MWRRIQALLWIAVAAFAMRACVMEPVRMSDDSMEPSLADGDVAFISKLFYGLRVPGSGSSLTEWASPQKGDLVVAIGVGDPPMTILRRITALPGEKYLADSGKFEELKAGEFFLSADKSSGTIDSRKFGPVGRRSLMGKVTYIWRPQKNAEKKLTPNDTPNAKSASPEAGTRVDSPKSKRRSP